MKYKAQEINAAVTDSCVAISELHRSVKLDFFEVTDQMSRQYINSTPLYAQLMPPSAPLYIKTSSLQNDLQALGYSAPMTM